MERAAPLPAGCRPKTPVLGGSTPGAVHDCKNAGHAGQSMTRSSTLPDALDSGGSLCRPLTGLPVPVRWATQLLSSHAERESSHVAKSGI